MDIRKVKKLIELLDESGIAEIEITEGEESVRISRYAPGAPAPPPRRGCRTRCLAVPAPPQRLSRRCTRCEAEEDGYEVTRPMVGTFYGASSPGAAPYVQVGDRVSEGDTLVHHRSDENDESDRSGRIRRHQVDSRSKRRTGRIRTNAVRNRSTPRRLDGPR